MAQVTMTMEEYLQLLNGLSSDMQMPIDQEPVQTKPKKKTAYQKRYEKNFRKIEKDFKKKNGQWKKNGFKNAVKMAHKMSKK